jgi:hypothetical protein
MGDSGRFGKVVFVLDGDDGGWVVAEVPSLGVRTLVQPPSTPTTPAANRATKSRRSIDAPNRQECGLIASGLAHGDTESC